MHYTTEVWKPKIEIFKICLIKFEQKKENKLSDFWRRRIVTTATSNVENSALIANGNENPVEDIVIDRVDEIRKSTNDVHNYR
jgi:hypothetical protein